MVANIGTLVAVLAGMGNIVFGILFIIGGASGEIALRGTGSSTALIVVGAAMCVWGGVQLARKQEEYGD